MAIKTQLRLNQLTASFGGLLGPVLGDINDGGVNPGVENKAALADIAVVDLSGSLSYLATAIRRVHGGLDFSDQTAGLFSHATTNFSGIVDATGDVKGATLQPDGDTSVGDNAAIGYTAAEGIIITGQGSTNDVTIKNDADVAVVNIPTGGTAVNFVGNVSGSLLKPGGDTSAGLGAALGYTAAEGIIITGQGSTNDVTIKNDADAAVIQIPTGTTQVHLAGSVNAASADIVGDLTAANLIADGDVSSGDLANIGYTAADGLIITGQGSSSDVTIRNDAKALVMSVPTGTTNVAFAGDVDILGGDLIVLAAQDAAASLTLSADNADDDGDSWLVGAAADQSFALMNDISSAPVAHLSITPHAVVANSVVATGGNLKVGGNIIQAADGGSTITMDASDKVTFAGNLDHADTAWTIGGTITTPANKITLGGGAAVEILGDLFVKGTEHIIDTDNLRIKDPLIAFGAGAITANANGGMALISGSSGPAASFAGGQADMVFGRVAVNTWGAGIMDTQSGSITSVAGMGMANMRVRNLELSGSANYLTFDGTNLEMVAGADIILDPGGNNVLPGSNNADDLGASGTAWKKVWALALDAGGGAITNVGALAGTLSTAAQANVTSLGTLTTLSVDNITINGNDISSTAGTDLTITPLTGQQIVLDGAIVVDAGVVTGATSITSAAFVGDITGDVTGNADTATESTNITAVANNSTDETVYPTFVDGATGTQGIETDTGLTYNPSSGLLTSTLFAGDITGDVTGNASGTAATVTGAAQTAITSVGTLTALQVDNLNLNGNTLSSTAGTDLLITPLTGQQIVLDGAIVVDAGVVTGATSITSTNFVGIIDGALGSVTPTTIVGTTITANTSILPDANDGAVLGAAGTAFSSLFLAEGAVINWDSGDLTMTQTGNLLAIAGGNTRVDRLELDGATNYLDVDTNIEIVAAADISLQSTGVEPFAQFNRAGAGESYMNFSTNDGAGITAGSGGFGFRNNAGTVQFKNSGGSWSSFGASAAASKSSTVLTGSIAAGARLGIDGGFNMSGIAGASQTNMVDVFVNGQMMLSGGTAASITNDYAVNVMSGNGSASDLNFNFALDEADVVTVTVR